MNTNKTRSIIKEPIHRMLQIEQPKNWVLVLLLFMLLIALILWAFFGKIPSQVEGRSVSISPNGVFVVQSKTKGILLKTFVREGDIVDVSDPLAQIDNPKLKSLINAIESTEVKIKKLQTELTLLENTLKTNQRLYLEGLIAKIQLDQSMAEVLNKEISIEENKTSLFSLYTDLDEASPTNRQKIIDREIDVLKTDEVINLQKMEETLSILYPPSQGRVLEVLASEGDLIDRKEPIVWMEHPKKPGETAVFYGAVEANVMGKIEVGMKVLIEPSIVNPSEYGAIVGKVKEIRAFPVSKDELLQSMKNPQIVSYLMGKLNIVTNIIVEPEEDNSTPSGYKWTSKKGPPFEIPTGTLCKLKLVVEEQSPISYLIPIWKLKS